VDKSIITILGALNNQIDSKELAAALKDDNFEGEYALTEDGIASILTQTKGLLSVDAAINNEGVIEKISKDLYPKHMKSALSKVEEQLKPVLDKIGVDYSGYEFVSDAIKDIEPKISELSSGGDNKGLIESLNEDIRKEKTVNENLILEHQKSLKERDDNILTDKLRQIYTSKATEKQWAEAYSDPDLKQAILDQKWNKINAKASLKLDESGKNIIPMQKEFPDKELYLDGNTITTFQSLLEPEFEPYLKKSSPEKVITNGHVSADGTELTEADKKRKREYDRQVKRAAE